VVPDGFVRALDCFEALVARVPPDRWDAPSPCEGWCAADVVDHVIGDLRGIQGYATGRQAESVADPRSAARDDPLAAWRTARADMTAALDAAALAQTVHLPWGGDMALRDFVERYPLEILVHAWDLAQATGQAAALDPDLVGGALETARLFAPAGRAAGLIGPERAVPGDADDLTRLLAIFGRSATDTATRHQAGSGWRGAAGRG
jgi:uncharacterized protein (TIGR03086 family)